MKIFSTIRLHPNLNNVYKKEMRISPPEKKKEEVYWVWIIFLCGFCSLSLLDIGKWFIAVICVAWYLPFFHSHTFHRTDKSKKVQVKKVSVKLSLLERLYRCCSGPDFKMIYLRCTEVGPFITKVTGIECVIKKIFQV